MAKNKAGKWRTREAVAVAQKAALKAFRTGCEGILTKAIDDTPIDTGTLRRSGTVTVGDLPDAEEVYKAAEAGITMEEAFPHPVGTDKTVYISFNTPYAERQHEDSSLCHPRGGKAKYLEDVFNREKDKVLKYAEASIKKALREMK